VRIFITYVNVHPPVATERTAFTSSRHLCPPAPFNWSDDLPPRFLLTTTTIISGGMTSRLVNYLLERCTWCAQCEALYHDLYLLRTGGFSWIPNNPEGYYPWSFSEPSYHKASVTGLMSNDSIVSCGLVAGFVGTLHFDNQLLGSLPDFCKDILMDLYVQDVQEAFPELSTLECSIFIFTVGECYGHGHLFKGCSSNSRTQLDLSEGPEYQKFSTT